jgi:hypothetical protein
VPGVTLQLVNNAFKPQTDVSAFGGSYSAMDQANQAGITATQVTNSDGNYLMNDVPNGFYTLAATSTVPGQLLLPAGGSTAPVVTVAGNSVSSDFTAQTLTRGGVPSTFTLHVSFTHLSAGLTLVAPYRRIWSLFIPFFYTVNCSAIGLYAGGVASVTPNSPGQNTASWVFKNGYTEVFNTCDNCFYFQFMSTEDFPRSSSLLYMPLSPPPRDVYYTYDFWADTFTQTFPPGGLIIPQE